MKRVVYLILSTFLFVQLSPCYAQIASDFDGDGVSDIASITLGSEITWKFAGSVSPTTLLDTSFGLSTDFIALAHWLGEDQPNLGIVRPSKDGKSLKWKILINNALVQEESFGKPSDNIISGGDFDGDGVTDAATVQKRAKKLVWKIHPGLFIDPSAKVRSFKLGVDGDRVFFLNYDGSGDWAAAFGKNRRSSRIVMRNLISGQRVTVNRFPKFLSEQPRPRPVPIAQGDGTDAIGFFISDETDTTLRVYALDASLISKVTFPGLGTPVIGDFDSEDPGEEVAFQSSNKITIYNPFSGANSTRAAVVGTPIDEINIGLLAKPTPAPTIVPTSVPTPG